MNTRYLIQTCRGLGFLSRVTIFGIICATLAWGLAPPVFPPGAAGVTGEGPTDYENSGTGHTAIQGPVLSDINPTAAPLLSIVTIHGSGFSTNSSDNLVRLGLKVAASRTLSGSEIQFIIPDGLRPGMKTVTVETRGQISSALDLEIIPPATPDVLTGWNYNLDVSTVIHRSSAVPRGEMTIRAASGGDMIFPGSLEAFRGLFPTPYFHGNGLSSFAVSSDPSRASLYVTPLPGHTGLVKDTPIPNLAIPSSPGGVYSTTSGGVVSFQDGAVTFFPMPTDAGVPIYTPVFFPDPDFDILEPIGLENPLLLPGVWLPTLTSLAQPGSGPSTVIRLPPEAGSALAPPVSLRNPAFSSVSGGSYHPFDRSTMVTTENGVVSILEGTTTFIQFPGGSGRPIGSPVQQVNPFFRPAILTADPPVGDGTPFLSSLLVAATEGLITVRGSEVGFDPVPAGSGSVIAQPSFQFNPDFSVVPSTSPSLDEGRLFTSTIHLTTDQGLVEVDDALISFTPVPDGAGRVVSPAITRINPDFNPFYSIFPVGSPRPFSQTVLVTTTVGLVFFTDGNGLLIPVPPEAGQVLSPPIFSLNAEFNSDFDPANPAGSPFPFSREIIVGTTNGVVTVMDKTPDFIPLPFGAGMPTGSPLPVTIPGLGTEILVPVTNGVVRMAQGPPEFIPLPAGAGSLVGAPFIEPDGQMVLAVTRGAVWVDGRTTRFTALPLDAGEVISSAVPSAQTPGGTQFILATTNGFAHISRDSVSFIGLPLEAGQHITPRLFLTRSPVINLPPVPNAGGDRTVNAGSPVTFNGSGSYDPDGTIVSYQWDFGDGGTAHGPVVTHAYPAPGIYTVTLVVIDDEGVSASETVRVTVIDATAPAVTIEAPVGGQTILAGQTFLIRWASMDNVAVTSHDILMSLDGVNDTATIVSGLPGSAQSFNWVVPPQLSTSTARVRVIARDAAGNAGQGESGSFTIRDTQPPIVSIQSPVAGEVVPAGEMFRLRWSSTDNVGVTNVDVFFSSDGINFNNVVAAGLSSTTTEFNWFTPRISFTSSARIRIVARDAVGNEGQGDAGPFTIRDLQPPALSIQSPVGGESISGGSPFLVRWTSADNIAVISHDIRLAVDGVNFNTTIASGLSGPTQQFVWPVSAALATSSSRIRIVARDAAGNESQSESGPFRVIDTIPPSVTVIVPGGGQFYNAGSNLLLSWSASDNVAVVSQDILLSLDGGITFQTVIASGLSGAVNQFLWSVPGSLVTTSAVVSVAARDAAGNSGRGESGIFTVRDTQPPTVTVVAPGQGQIVNPGSFFTVSWSSSDNVGVVNHDILLSTNGGASYTITVAQNLSGGMQSFNWNVPPNFNTTQARIRIRAVDMAGNVGIGETRNFTIRDTFPPVVTVTAPGDGQNLNPATQFTILWTSSDNVGVTSHDLQLSINGGQTYTPIASNIGGGLQAYNWTVPTVNTTQARLRVLARDAAGNQGLSETGTFVIRDSIPPTVSLQSPGTGQVIPPGTLFTIRWVSTDNIAVDSQDVFYSTNDGRTYTTIVSGLPGTRQQWDWLVPPDLDTTQARIRVTARDPAGNTGQAETGRFTIRDNEPPTISLIAPIGGEVMPQGSQFTIRWTSSDNTAVSSHDVQLSTNGGTSYSTFAGSLPGSQQSYAWTVPGNLATTQARIRVVVRDRAGNTNSATSGNFVIQDQTPPTITVARPSAGEVVTAGGPYTIRWTSSDNVGVTGHEIRLSTDGGATFATVVASNLSGTQQSFNWPVPSSLASPQAVIRVNARDAAGNSGSADSGRFTIQSPAMPPTVRVLYPNGGETLTTGSTVTIRWTSTDDAGVVSHDLLLSLDGGLSFNVTIQTMLSGATQEYNWTVPANLSTTRGRVRVIARDASSLSAMDESDRDFSIQPGGGPGGQFALVAARTVALLGGLPGSGSILTSIPVTGTATEVAVAPDRQYALVLTAGGRVSVITSPGSPAAREIASLNVGANPTGVAISPDSRVAVVLVNSDPVGLVPIVGLPNNPTVGSAFVLNQVPAGVQDVALSSLGTVVVTAPSIGGIVVVDGLLTSLTPSLRGVQRTGSTPAGVVFSRDGDTCFVVNRGNSNVVTVAGLTPGRRLSLGRALPTGANPLAITLSPDGVTALVTNQGEDSVTIFRLAGASLAELTTVKVGRAPGGVSVSGDGNAAIVSNTGDQTVSVITGLRSSPVISPLVGPSVQLQTGSDREQSVAFVP